MTAATGTGYTKLLNVMIEHFDDLSSANFNFQGAFAYLGWSFALSGNHVTLLHADYMNFSNLIVYLHWGFELPTGIHEHSVYVTDVMMKYGVNYHIIP